MEYDTVLLVQLRSATSASLEAIRKLELIPEWATYTVITREQSFFHCEYLVLKVDTLNNYKK